MKYLENIINKVICGDCLEVMKNFPSNSVSTIITDAPYEISFMSKSWDSKGIAFNPKVWKEALRVAKPGATMLCFGGTRTYHRLACAIEDAGWIIKDCIIYLYGSGFPKATDISKQLDKRAGKKMPIGKGFTVAGKYRNDLGDSTPIGEERDKMRHKPQTPEVKLWNGWKSHGLKPAYEPILLCMKPNEGSYAENALRWNVAGLNINGARIGTGAKKWEKPRGGIWKTKPKEKAELIDNTLGRFPSNLILECICDEVKEGKDETISIHDAPKGTFAGGEQNRGSIKNYRERNVGKAIIHTNPECPCYILDRQSGKSKSTPRTPSEKHHLGSVTNFQRGSETSQHNDKGGVSRFFYCAKANREERNRGLEEFEAKKVSDGRKKEADNAYQRGKTLRTNTHPTVKPLKLMEYLCLLTKTPKGGIILDPFAGSGTTGMAAKKVGRDYILIEKEEDYSKIAEARIKAVPQPLL